MPNTDYVTAGAGAAGCVLANRPSEDPDVPVLPLEAGGGDASIDVMIPAAFPNRFHTKLDRDDATEPEPHADGGRRYIPRGRSLGASSSITAVLDVRGHPLDHALWEDPGAPGRGRIGAAAGAAA